MQKLIDLTSKIKKWNMIGYSLLPTLELVLINGKAYQQKTQNILQLFKSSQLHIVNENNWKQEIKQQKSMQKMEEEKPIAQVISKQATKIDRLQKIQRIFLMGNGVEGRLFVIQGLSDTQIKDQEFRSRKKLIDKYRRKKCVIFIVFAAEDKKQIEKGQQQLIEFGLIKNMESIILCDNLYSDTRLIHQILLKYENSFKYDLVTNYRIMKDNKKQQQKLSKRYIQWRRLINKQENVLTFSLMSFRQYSESMRSSFSGTYSTSSHYENLGVGKSINWKVMELLHQFWDVQSDILFKQVDSFPLSYIEQQYKMSDHYSIGGFLPDTCFKAIFSPPLYQFRDCLISTVQAIKVSILHHIQLSITYIFKHASILDIFLQRQLQTIQQICDKFISQLKNSLQSQIQFIHANPEDFWNYRQLNSSFYSPDQQVYIEIKYIGKSYVRKVYQSIKDAVPRLIGQGLLKKIQKYICGDAVNSFIDITKEKQFQIVMTSAQVNKYESDLELLKQLDGLITFFSLKVNASFLIKNFHEKKQKQWDRMFGRSQKIIVQQKNNEVMEKGGILNWMKKIFKRNRNQNIRRANSGEKKAYKPVQKQDLQKQKKAEANKNVLINEKNWLLIINTGRQVSHERIKLSAIQGFPHRFRASIWTYLSTHKKAKSQKLKSLLERAPDPATLKQIQKDIPRTSPGQLFRYSMKTSLRNVLVAYSLYDKQISYTQGMNFITAVILTTLIGYGDKSSPLVDNRINYDQVEQRAFCILKHIMQECQVRKLMLIQVNMLADLSLRLSDRIKQLSPKMHTLIQSTQFSCQMIFSSPLISCLSNVTKDLYLMRRFLDILITHDFMIVYKIIAQFVAHCELVSAKLNVDNIYDYLKNKMYDEVFAMIGEQGLSVLFTGL